jgi:hypothetical protein
MDGVRIKVIIPNTEARGFGSLSSYVRLAREPRVNAEEHAAETQTAVRGGECMSPAHRGRKAWGCLSHGQGGRWRIWSSA